MREKLEKMGCRFDELNRMLGDPAVIGNLAEFKKLSKERAGLQETVEDYRRLRNLEKEIASNRELAEKEHDPEIRKMALEEIPPLEAQKTELEEAIKILLIPKDPYDDKNVFLEIRAGTGGEEAGLFAAELFRMYQRFCERRGWPIEVQDSSPTGIGGFKEIIALIRGEGAYSFLKYEGGAHRVQRVPRTETQGRVHTSAVTVAILPEPDDVEVQIEENDLRVDTFSAGGPGGQHVNKTASAVRLTHVPTGIVVVCRDERSQHKNKARAMKVLKAKVFEKKLQEQQEKQAAKRKGMIGTGDRSQKIRTYNFPQNRLTDHRVNLTLYQLDKILDGGLDQVLEPLRLHDRKAALKG